MEKRKFTYIFNPKDNGGESVYFEYTISPVDGDTYACETEAIIGAYCYGASTSMIKIHTPLDIKDFATKLLEFALKNNL